MTTSHRKTSDEADEIIELESTRYTLQMQVLGPDLKQLQKLYTKEPIAEDKTTLSLKMQKTFFAMMETARKVDDMADLLPWIKTDDT